MFKVGDRVQIVLKDQGMNPTVVNMTGKLLKPYESSGFSAHLSWVFEADPAFEGTTGLHRGTAGRHPTKRLHHVSDRSLKLLEPTVRKKTKFAEWMKESGDRYV